MLVQFDKLSGAFVRPDGAPSGGLDEVCARLNEALTEVRGWLKLKLRNGKCTHGFLIEMAFRSVCRHDTHVIYDEIGKLEGTDIRPSFTKKARKMRAPLCGLWHKHYYHAGFLVRNLKEETEKMAKDGRWERMFTPHYGKYVHEFASQIVHEMVMGAYERRAQDRRMTGEFIVYEVQPDGSNYYLTLGLHGEYDAIRVRVTAYKQFDLGEGL